MSQASIETSAVTPGDMSLGSMGSDLAGLGGSPAVPLVENDPVPAQRQETTINTFEAAAPAAIEADETFTGIIPEGFADKPWVKEIKSVDQMFKMLEDQKTALSRRPAGIPQDNASDDEKAAFAKAMGVPESDKDYAFGEAEATFSDADKAFHDKLRPLLKSAGVSANQLKVLAPGFQEVMQGLGNDLGVSPEAKDKAFNELADKAFGERKETVFENGKKLLGLVPAEMQSILPELDNGSLIRVAAVLDSIREQYISEDRLPKGNGGNGLSVNGSGIDHAAGTVLMQTPAYTNFRDPKHEETVARVNALFGNASRS